MEKISKSNLTIWSHWTEYHFEQKKKRKRAKERESLWENED